MSDSGEPSDSHLMAAPSTSGDETPGSEGRRESGGMGPAVSAADAGAGTTNGTSASSKRTPYCAKCRIHGLNNLLKGHKLNCKYRFHNCTMCLLTTVKQRITAIQTADRRWAAAQRVEDDRKRAAGILKPDEVPPENLSPSPCSTSMVLPVPAACSFGASPVPPPGHPHVPLLPPPTHQLNPPAPIPPLPPPVPLLNPQGPLPPMQQWQQWPSSSTLDTEDTTQSLRPEKPTVTPASDNVDALLKSVNMIMEIFRFPVETMPLVLLVLKHARSNVKEASHRIVEAQEELRTMVWRETTRNMYYPSTYSNNYFPTAHSYLPPYQAACASQSSPLFLPTQLYPIPAPPPPPAPAPGPAPSAPMGVHGAPPPPSPPRPQQSDDATSSTTYL